MITDDDKHESQDESSRESWESEGGTGAATPEEQRDKRDERWKVAKDAHWHHAGYSAETQERSETEDRS
jgi:hypothetical protein